MSRIAELNRIGEILNEVGTQDLPDSDFYSPDKHHDWRKMHEVLERNSGLLGGRPTHFRELSEQANLIRSRAVVYTLGCGLQILVPQDLEGSLTEFSELQPLSDKDIVNSDGVYGYDRKSRATLRTRLQNHLWNPARVSGGVKSLKGIVLANGFTIDSVSSHHHNICYKLGSLNDTTHAYRTVDIGDNDRLKIWYNISRDRDIDGVRTCEIGYERRYKHIFDDIFHAIRQAYRDGAYSVCVHEIQERVTIMVSYSSDGYEATCKVEKICDGEPIAVLDFDTQGKLLPPYIVFAGKNVDPAFITKIDDIIKQGFMQRGGFNLTDIGAALLLPNMFSRNQSLDYATTIRTILSLSRDHGEQFKLFMPVTFVYESNGHE